MLGGGGCNEVQTRKPPRPLIEYTLTVGDGIAKVRINHHRYWPINECIIDVYGFTNVRVLYRDSVLLVPFDVESPIVIESIEPIYDIVYNSGLLGGGGTMQSDRVEYYLITVKF